VLVAQHRSDSSRAPAARWWHRSRGAAAGHPGTPESSLRCGQRQNHPSLGATTGDISPWQTVPSPPWRRLPPPRPCTAPINHQVEHAIDLAPASPQEQKAPDTNAPRRTTPTGPGTGESRRDRIDRARGDTRRHTPGQVRAHRPPTGRPTQTRRPHDATPQARSEHTRGPRTHRRAGCQGESPNAGEAPAAPGPPHISWGLLWRSSDSPPEQTCCHLEQSPATHSGSRALVCS